MPAKIFLEVVSGPICGQSFTFDRHDTFLFGRGGDCHAKLPRDGLVSRHHFLLETNPPDARVRDLGSLNGTLVNDVKHGGRNPDESPEAAVGRDYSPVDLVDGDRLTVGNTAILVRVLRSENCCECGLEIAGPDLEAAVWHEQRWMCGACRGSQATARPTTVAPATPRCQNCGQDVSDELSAGRRGDYICAACRNAISSDGGGFLQLVQRAAAAPVHCSGLNLAEYNLGDELGRGSMGIVYAAQRKRDGRPVAIKIMLSRVAVEPRSRQMFEREIALSSQLRHPQIVEVLETGNSGSIFFAVMEYCAHGSLDRLIRRQGGRLSLDAARPLMRQCLAGLAHAHEPRSEGQPRLVHRDIKPHNILLADDHGMMSAKIADFGLAKSFEMAGLSGMTATGAVGGTCYFMPREQLTNFKYVQPASDVWSMAATFYYMLAGHVPLDFPAGRDAIEVILRDEPVPLRKRAPQLPAALCSVLDRALSTDLAVRYRTGGELQSALTPVLESR